MRTAAFAALAMLSSPAPAMTHRVGDGQQRSCTQNRVGQFVYTNCN